MLVAELYQQVVDNLETAGFDDARADASCLLAHRLKIKTTQLFLARNHQVSPQDRQAVESDLARRLNHEPLAYIFGEKEFWSLAFKVNRDVLIPRPETERLVELALAAIGVQQPGTLIRLLDAGTGSGAIAVSLARELPAAVVYAVDCSWAALKVAAENVVRHKVTSRVHLVAGDWLAGFKGRPCFQVVVANPPYIARELLEEHPGVAVPGGLEVSPEVRLHEPRLALDGGWGGGDQLERLSRQVAAVLLPGGSFFMEIGADQAGFVMDLFQELPDFNDLKVENDYAGLPRVFQAVKKKVARRQGAIYGKDDY